MRHTGGYNDYIAGRDIHLNSIVALFAFEWFGTTEHYA
jgi:hypothetical protein